MTYQRIMLRAFGGPEQLELETVDELPQPAPGQVRVKVLTPSSARASTRG
jgi:NADPH:quinone reductase-like Zn-dependent oxidoreductase